MPYASEDVPKLFITDDVQSSASRQERRDRIMLRVLCVEIIDRVAPCGMQGLREPTVLKTTISLST